MHCRNIGLIPLTPVCLRFSAWQVPDLSKGTRTMRATLQCAVYLLMASLFCSTSFGSINLCLAENGGILESGSESIRDGDLSTIAMEIVGQSGSMTATIAFDQLYHVDSLRSIVGGAMYQYDGGACGWTWLYLMVDGNWETIGHWGWSTWQSYADDATFDNGGVGWDEATKMRLYGYIEAFDTGTSVLQFYEMDASAQPIPEPSTLAIWSLLGTLGAGTGWWRRCRAK